MNFRTLSICCAILSCNLVANVVSYSQVAVSGSQEASAGPKVFKSLNTDLIFPMTFNATAGPTTPTNVTPKPTSNPTPSPPTQVAFLPTIAAIARPEPQTAASNNNEPLNAESTGRAVDYRPYPFQQLIVPTNKVRGRPPPSPVYHRPPSNIRSRPGPVITTDNVYPGYHASRTPSRAEIDKLSGKGKAKDRFTPGEATASHLYKNKPAYMYNGNGGSKGIAPAASTSVDTYVPPKNLYAFPPNTNINYPSPVGLTKNDGINSYLPPASGPIANDDGGFKGYPGPLNPEYLPANMQNGDNGGNNGGSNGNDDDPNDSHIGEIIAGGEGDDTKDQNQDNGHDLPPEDHSHSHDHDHPAEDHGHAHDHPAEDHGHDHDHDLLPQPVEDDHLYPTPPPDYFDNAANDHHHEHGLDHPKNFFDYVDHGFPDYDHHPHHHPEPPPPPPPITTEIPEPPPEPRVKKYSYFYIGRKLWYIPLYFTVWFSFYVLWLILKSIARHKVNLPNHVVAKRSVPEWSHKKATERIDRLTVKVMENIEAFKTKYIA